MMTARLILEDVALFAGKSCGAEGEAWGEIVFNTSMTGYQEVLPSDRLYFEPLTPEDVINILELEQPRGIVVQFGGQTAINLAEPLYQAGIKILGTAVADIDLVTVADKDKEEILPLMQKLAHLGYRILATRGTALFLAEKGLQVETVNKIREGSPHVVDTILSGKVDLVINTLT